MLHGNALLKKFAEQFVKDIRYTVPAGYNLTAEGPDSTFFVYHASEVSSYDCVAMLTEDFVSKMREFGFRKVVCTDDKATTFTFDPIAQTPADVRKSFAETIRRKDLRSMAGNPVLGYNLTAEGPDSTFYVYHQSGVTSSDRTGMLASQGFASRLRELGFIRLTCTDDGANSFAFDLNAQATSIPAQVSSQQSAPPAAVLDKQTSGSPPASVPSSAAQVCPLSVTQILRGGNMIVIDYKNLSNRVITGAEFTTVFIDAVGNRHAGLNIVSDDRVKVGKKTHSRYAMYLYQDQRYFTELTLQKVAFEDAVIWNRADAGGACTWTSR